MTALIDRKSGVSCVFISGRLCNGFGTMRYRGTGGQFTLPYGLCAILRRYPLSFYF